MKTTNWAHHKNQPSYVLTVSTNVKIDPSISCKRPPNFIEEQLCKSLGMWISSYCQTKSMSLWLNIGPNLIAGLCCCDSISHSKPRSENQSIVFFHSVKIFCLKHQLAVIFCQTKNLYKFLFLYYKTCQYEFVARWKVDNPVKSIVVFHCCITLVFPP